MVNNCIRYPALNSDSQTSQAFDLDDFIPDEEAYEYQMSIPIV